MAIARSGVPAAVLVAISLVVAVLVLDSSVTLGSAFTGSNPSSAVAAQAQHRGLVWTNRTGSIGVAPSVRSGSAVVYDAAIGSVLLFGGLASNGTLLEDTWTYHAGVWSDLNLSPSASPRARAFASIAYDAADGVVLLFGGLDRAVPSNAAKLGDTWEFSGGAWTELHPTASPSARYAASMTYDAATQRVMLFGGNSTAGPVSDTWTFHAGAWTKFSAVNPTPRYGAGMTYDPALKDVLLYGGIGLEGTASKTLTMVWIFNGTAWANSHVVSYDRKPLQRFGPGFASNGNLTLFVGGSEGGANATAPGPCRKCIGGEGTDYNAYTLSVTPSARCPGSPRYPHCGIPDARWGLAIRQSEAISRITRLPDQFPGLVWDASDGYFLYLVDGQTWTVD